MDWLSGFCLFLSKKSIFCVQKVCSLFGLFVLKQRRIWKIASDIWLERASTFCSEWINEWKSLFNVE